MPAASACAVSSPAAASGTCRPPPTTCASYTGSLSAAPDQPRRGTPTATGPSSEPPEAHQGRLPAMLNHFKRQRPTIQQQAPGQHQRPNALARPLDPEAAQASLGGRARRSFEAQGGDPPLAGCGNSASQIGFDLIPSPCVAG